MKYLLLIYVDPDRGPAPDSPEAKTEMEGYFALTHELQGAGRLISGEPLQGIDTATTVTVRAGQTLTTDGPFAETKEILGGYYLVDVADLDEAIAWAAKIPSSAHGKIEVRPLREMPSM